MGCAWRSQLVPGDGDQNGLFRSEPCSCAGCAGLSSGSFGRSVFAGMGCGVPTNARPAGGLPGLEKLRVLSSFRQRATARAPTRAQRMTAFWLESDAASRETSRDDLAVDARAADFADIATLVVHIAGVDLRAPVRQSHRVTFNRANRAGIAQNRRVRASEVERDRRLSGRALLTEGPRSVTLAFTVCIGGMPWRSRGTLPSARSAS
jgi:hypothetical protein